MANRTTAGFAPKNVTSPYYSWLTVNRVGSPFRIFPSGETLFSSRIRKIVYQQFRALLFRVIILLLEMSTQFSDQLKEACKAAGAQWAVWFHRIGSEWSIEASHGLSAARQSRLLSFVSTPKTTTWLGGAFHSGRARVRQTGAAAKDLGCQRISVYPNLAARRALLVGSDGLDRTAETIFRVLSKCPPVSFLQEVLPVSSPVPEPESPDTGLEVSYDPEVVLGNVLHFLAGLAPCESALLSIRSGDSFRIASVWNCPASMKGRSISFQGNKILSTLVRTREGVILDNPWRDPSLSSGLALASNGASWMSVPIVLGQRVIGHLEFTAGGSSPFQQEDLARVAAQAARLAHMVENSIVFSEATRYLQQFALLNELSSAAVYGSDTNEVSRRLLQRLMRTFHARKAAIYLANAEGNIQKKYSLPGEPVWEPGDFEQKYVLPVLHSGSSLWSPQENSGLKETRPGKDETPAGSVLVAPLKYRGKITGAIALQNGEANGYSPQDEQLLILIAGHLAGLYENMRLSDETREWARNLGLIHQVVLKVLELTNVPEIAQVAARLLVEGFSYEVAAVFLKDEPGQVWSAGLDEPDVNLKFEESFSNPACTVSCVLADGQSRLIHDLEEAGEGYTSGHFRPGSAMCVPLREGEQIFGVIIVFSTKKGAFSGNDLLALEALSGVLSSVFLGARRYQELQESYRQLQAVRESAIDLAVDLDLDALLRRVVHRARELVGARGAELGLLDEKDGVVKILVSETPWVDNRGEAIPLMAGVAGRVAAFGEPVVISDYNAWSGRLYPEQEAPYCTVAGVPLKYRGSVVGTLTVFDDRPDWLFKPEHIQLLELLAPQATVWIRNARLYQELQERIKAQHEAETRLVRSARLAAVGEMAAGVAHELNNPLTTVSGFVELILDELDKDSPNREDLELVLREAQRARGVVRRLLDFSRPVENQRTRTDLNLLVSDVLALVRHLARTGGIQVSLTLADGLPWVLVDPGHIKQVLLNLFHNAIQAMPQGGRLDVSTGKARYDEKDWLTVTIRDNGTGIPPENLNRIFEPFFTTRSAGSGTGLGLSVSYGIVKEHGGFIEVDSQEGVGSSFQVYLPVESGETSD